MAPCLWRVANQSCVHILGYWPSAVVFVFWCSVFPSLRFLHPPVLLYISSGSLQWFPQSLQTTDPPRCLVCPTGQVSGWSQMRSHHATFLLLSLTQVSKIMWQLSANTTDAINPVTPRVLQKGTPYGTRKMELLNLSLLDSRFSSLRHCQLTSLTSRAGLIHMVPPNVHPKAFTRYNSQGIFQF